MNKTNRPDPMPLDEFPPEMRERIEAQASGDRPPPKWLDVGFAQIHSRGWYEWHIRRGRDPFKARPKIPAHIRRAVLERDGMVCQLCTEPITDDTLHIDHKVPVALGGPTTVDNLQVAHAICNLRKGAKVGPS